MLKWIKTHLTSKPRTPSPREARRIANAKKSELYHRYLRSWRWRIKRQRVLIRDRGRCQICGGRGRTIHHLTYRQIFREPLYDLLTVCDACHKAIHSG